MKDGPEVAEGVKTACSATNGHMLDEHNGGSDNALPVGGTLLDTDTAKAKGDSKAFSCSICNRKFGYKHVLQNHERTHTGEKPFECPECHKRFTRDHHLKTHMRLHTGEKPYQCQHCERHFVQVANLRRHLRVHTGERPYGCQLCESRFSDSNQLKAHMLIHRGEKPFQCVQCKGRFRRRHHLIHHKCPKDESNLGKPRRGRRPKAYEQMVDDEDNGDDPDELPLTDNEENLNHTSSSEADQPSPESTPDSGVDTINNNNNHIEDSPSPLAMSNGLISNGRRKASRTIRILTPQQRELFLRDKVTMQTQAIDMSLSPSPIEVQPVTVIVPNRFLNSVEGVLDLSSSRSDSEIEVIEEDVDCRCLRNGVRTAPGCNNLLGMIQPLNHSDDSDESTDNRHHSTNGIDTTIPLTAKKVNGRHSDDSDESLNHLSLNGSDMEIPLAARKTNGHHSEDSNGSSHYHYPMNGVEGNAIPLTTKKANGHHSEDSASLHFHHPLLNGNAKRNDDSSVPLIPKTVLVNGHYGGGGTSNHHYPRKLTNGHNKHSRCEDGHSVVIPLKKVHVSSSNRTNGHLHSDDSNDSSHRLNLHPHHHHHHTHLPVINGIKHLGEDDNSMAIPLTRKKTHVASTA